MNRTTGGNRRFLFLQGPHGPFFRELGEMLRRAGAEVWRVGFNRGDQAYWGRDGYIPFTGAQPDWPARCAALMEQHAALMEQHAITDLVLYGDTRFVHAEAVRLAKARGVCVHVFEEGYLRPWWVTYERGGSNGNSRLMGLGVAAMREALAQVETDLIDAPAHWGDMRQHVFYGAAYHARLLLANRAYRNFRPHRALNVRQEFALHLKRLLAMPCTSSACWRCPCTPPNARWPPGGCARAGSRITWRSCNWSTTPVSATIRRFPR